MAIKEGYFTTIAFICTLHMRISYNCFIKINCTASCSSPSPSQLSSALPLPLHLLPKCVSSVFLSLYYYLLPSALWLIKKFNWGPEKSSALHFIATKLKLLTTLNLDGHLYVCVEGPQVTWSGIKFNHCPQVHNTTTDMQPHHRPEEPREDD